MVKKLQITKEILLAKITPWMGKNFGPFFWTRVSFFYMSAQYAQMINSLLPYEYCSTL
jgi:hypothetical protein